MRLATWHYKIITEKWDGSLKVYITNSNELDSLESFIELTRQEYMEELEEIIFAGRTDQEEELEFLGGLEVEFEFDQETPEKKDDYN